MLGALLACGAAFGPGLRKLSGPLARLALADVSDYQLSADGAWVVYLADQDVDGQAELYARATAAGPRALRLDPPELGNRFPVAGSLRITSDGARVVFLAQGAASARRRLWSIALDGSAPARELAPLVAGGSVLSFQLTPRDEVVLLADALVDERVELFSVPADGSSAPLLLSGTLDPNGDVTEFALDPAATLAVFRADVRNDVFELYQVPLDASSAPVRLNGPLVANGDVRPDVQVHADGSVLYLADELRSGRVELFSVRAGFASIPLSTTAVNGGVVERARFTPDGTRAVFLAFRANANVRELFVVPRDGSRPPLMLHAPLVQRFGVRNDFQIAPDGSRVAFVMDRNVLGNYELFTAPLDGSGPEVQLNQTFPEPLQSVAEFRFGADGRRIAYRAPRGFHFHLYSAPSDGSAPAFDLDPRIHSIGDALGLVTVGTEVVYRAELFSTPELFAVPIEGGVTPRRLHPTLPFNAAVQSDYRVLDQQVVFLADLEGASVVELFRSPLDALAPPERLNAPLRGRGSIEGDVLGPYFAGERVLYLADQEIFGRREYYSAPADGSQPAVRLTSTARGGRLGGQTVSPDGRLLVFAGEAEESGRSELYCVPTDGSAPQRKLSAPMVAGGSVSDHLELSRDGRWAVYRADQLVDEQFELFAVPLDGSSDPVRLDPMVRTYGDVERTFHLTPDSTRVVYRSDRAVRDKQELYVVPIDGHAAPLRVSAPLVGGGDVDFDFQISPDSTRAVYPADQDVNDVLELFSAPLDGHAPAVRLNGTMVAGGDLRDFAISDDGAYVVYRADQDVNELIELFSVPIAGGAAPVRFFPQPERGFGPYRTAGGRVLFYAQPDGKRELFSAPLDGSALAVKLNGALLGTGGVGNFAITPDRRTVVYLAAQDVFRHPELYRVPLDGSAAPVRLTAGFSRFDTLDGLDPAPFDPQGRFLLTGVRLGGRDPLHLFLVALDPSVAPRRITPSLPPDRAGCTGTFGPSGERVYFVGDLAARQRFELYVTDLEPLPSVTPAPGRLR